MGGGGGGSTANYEKERQGVDRRTYGQLSKTGFQSRDAYERALAGTKLKQSAFTKTTTDEYGSQSTVEDTDAYHKALADSGLQYDSTYNRWSLASGVDFDAAKTDWENYSLERKDIATYDAQEARRKAAPDSLTGTSGKVDYSLAIQEDDKDKDKTTTTIAGDTSESTASTSQSLGIY